MARQKLSHIFTKIVFKPLRTNLFHIVLSAFFLTLGSAELYSQEKKNNSTTIPAEKQRDTATVSVTEILKPVDSTKTDSIKPKKGFLESRVKRKALDYEKMDQKKKLLTLYNQAELYYQDFELKAGIIVMDYSKNEVYAGRIKDSLGNYTQRPVFKQGANVIEPDSIRFNTQTKKALVWNSRSKQGEMSIKGEITKKENDSVYFIKNARITTSKDIDNPEYYFLARRLKLVPGKKVVVGLTNMVIADVPTPLGIPFAFFPMTDKGGTSGLILPSPNDTNRQGFSLQNGGLYLALSDNYDLAILGDYYTNGSYAMRFESSYAKRYNYRGNVNVRFENQIQSERGFPDYSRLSNYNIQWSHMKDTKSSPNSTFSASVNMGSSKYYQQSLNQANIGSALNNTMNSSISYSKRFNTVPQVNMSITAQHSQNTQTEQITMTLPTFQGSVDRVFLFASEDEVKKGFIKNMNIQYNLNAQNQITTYDSLFFKPQMFRDAKVGFRHSIPLSTNFKFLKYLSVSPQATYEEVWTLNTTEKRPNSTGIAENYNVRGFDSYRTYNFNTSVSTTIYGTFNFGEGKRIQAIRHLMKPSIGYTYTPNFDRYYDTFDPDGNGTRLAEYSRFENTAYGPPSRGNSNILSFNLTNTFEAKVRDQDSTKTEPKKVMLLNSLAFSTNYNINADSMKLAPLQVSAGTNLFKDKMNINFAAELNPYALSNTNRMIDKWNIDNGGSLFRLSRANFTVNYSFSSKDGAGESDRTDPLKNQGLRNGGREDDLFGTARDLGDNRQSQFNDEDIEEAEKKKSFYNAVLPWDLRLAYSLTYSNAARQNEITNNSLMISGNIDLTPRWKVGASTGYDFVQKGVTFTQLRFERDLLSWRMDFNWVPLGDYTSWGFFIGIKSSVLSDIKWDKRNQPDRTLR